jgi:hypothetical protein
MMGLEGESTRATIACIILHLTSASRLKLADSPKPALERSERSDCRIGYFNLRGWGVLAGAIDHYRGQGESRCRVLVGMVQDYSEEIKKLYGAPPPPSMSRVPGTMIAT